jgi:hypothetical protein
MSLYINRSGNKQYLVASIFLLRLFQKAGICNKDMMMDLSLDCMFLSQIYTKMFIFLVLLIYYSFFFFGIFFGLNSQNLSNEIDRIKKENDSMQIELRYIYTQEETFIYLCCPS